MISVQNMNYLKDQCTSLFSAITIAPNIIASKGEWEVVWIFDPTDETDKELIYEVSVDSPHNTLAEWYKSWQNTRKDEDIELFVPAAIVKDVATAFPVLIFFGSLGAILHVSPSYNFGYFGFDILSKFNPNLIMRSPSSTPQETANGIISRLTQDLYCHMQTMLYNCIFATENTIMYGDCVREWMSGNIS